jgi:hypothetical protein
MNNKNAYKLTYEVKDDNVNSVDFGYLVVKTKKFSSLEKAVDFSRRVCNTALVVGKPVIETVS